MDLSPSEIIIQTRINSVLFGLNEIQRRLYLGAEANSLGRGGNSIISRLSGINRKSLSRGMKEAKQRIAENNHNNICNISKKKSKKQSGTE